MKDMHNEEEGAVPGAELLRVDALLDLVLGVADRALLAGPSSFAERVVAQHIARIFRPLLACLLLLRYLRLLHRAEFNWSLPEKSSSSSISPSSE